MFPVEVYEHILKLADGQTLLQAELVCQQWKIIVDYLDKKHNLWKKCCKEEIPKIELYALTDKYWCSGSKDWKIIYKNWILWSNLNDRSHIVLKNQDLDCYFTCAKISGSLIVTGNLSGSLTVITEEDDVLYYFRTFSRSHVKDIFFLNEKAEYADSDFKHTHLLVAYENKLVLCQINRRIEEISTILDVIHYGVYKNYICYEYYTGQIIVAKINFELESIFEVITKCVIYSPTIVRTLSIWDEKVVLITDSNVLSFSYSSKTPIASASIGQVLPVSYCTVERYWIFYNEMLFTIGNDYLHVIKISEDASQVIENKFNVIEILNSSICDLYLHGRVFIISTTTGQVYIYVVKDWKNFDLKNYDYRISAHSEPVYSIDVQELEEEQRILLMTNACLIQVFIT